jgi:hypothetical protein
VARCSATPPGLSTIRLSGGQSTRSLDTAETSATTISCSEILPDPPKGGVKRPTPGEVNGISYFLSQHNCHTDQEVDMAKISHIHGGDDCIQVVISASTERLEARNFTAGNRSIQFFGVGLGSDLEPILSPSTPSSRSKPSLPIPLQMQSVVDGENQGGSAQATRSNNASNDIDGDGIQEVQLLSAEGGSRRTLPSAPTQDPTRQPPIARLPLEILRHIMSDLDGETQRVSRQVCRDWSAASPLFRNVVCHQDASIVDSLREKGLWPGTRLIAGGWSRGFSERLVKSLTCALMGKAEIEIRCLDHTTCGCCPPPIFTGIFSLEETNLWAIFTAVSQVSRTPAQIGQTPIQITRLELSKTVHRHFSPFILTSMRGIISANLSSLKELAYAYPHAIAPYVDEADENPWELESFLYECPQLTTLYLNIHSFADLPRIEMPKLKVLRVRIVDFNSHLLDFLERHETVEQLVISIVHWRLKYRNNSGINASKYRKCEITDSSTDPWTGRYIPPAISL